MSARTLNVLFLCTGNSARSIVAEALLNATGGRRLRACSAGSRPAGRVHPLALEVLERNGIPTEGLRSKSVEEVARSGSPKFQFVITLCGEAAGEACPVWSGQPIRAHWPLADPAAVEGSDEERRAAFAKTFGELQDRLLVFASLPLDKLERTVLERRLDEIGRLGADEAGGSTHLADRIQSASRPLRRSLRRRPGAGPHRDA